MPTLLGRSAWYDGYPSATPFLGAYPFKTTFGGPVLLGDGSINWAAMWPKVAGVLALASASVSAYHGFKRNQSVWGGVLWFFLGTLFPVVTPIAAIALPPGFAKKK
jgi:hypothetical protein